MSTRQPMLKKLHIPSQCFIHFSVLVSVVCMFLVVGSPVAFAKTDSNFKGGGNSVSVKKNHMKHSSRFLRVSVKGGGKILSSPQGLTCKGRTCFGKFPKGTKVVLEATPVSGKTFSGWRGACRGANKCTVRMNKHKNVRAVFSKPRLMRLAIKIKGNGKVQSTPSGLSCRKGYCTGRFQAGTVVTVEPQPGNGHIFSKWRGACRGESSCRVTLNRSKLLAAIFIPQGPGELVSLEAKISGEGTLTSQPAGLSCLSGTCLGKFPVGTQVVLNPAPEPGHEFSAWGGECSGNLGCRVTMDVPKRVTATFTPIVPQPVALSVTIDGSGVVKSTPGNLVCETGTCVENFDEGTKVVLSAQPKTNFMFAGWSAPCSGTESCEIAMTTAQKVTATFTPVVVPPVALMVTVEGEGRVTSDPAGIDCPAVTCKQDFENAKEVTLVAVPKDGHMFDGWSGACTGKESCTVTMSSAMSVKAVFSLIPLPPVALTVAVEGEGRITSDPAGIDCPAVTCKQDFENAKEVTLVAVPKDGHMFDGWSGACTGKESCTVTMSSATSVKASFSLISLPPVALSVTVAGEGQVTSTPVGIDCPAVSCMQNFEAGTMVILVANPNTGQTFSAWGGACQGSGTSCQVDMNLAQTVMATFVAGNPGMMTDQEAKRFLEQSTWGPTPALIAHVKTIGKEAFIDEQLALNLSAYPDPAATPESNSLTPTRNQFFHNAFHQDDQLRQRMAWALSQIFVVSANTVGSDFQMYPYLNLLRDGAFGNYEDVMRAVTLSPTMGRFLDMVNNDKTEPGSGLNPNENYPREFLQLFSVGTVLLNPDGSEQPGSIPPYDQDVILNLSRVMTGWTYPTKPGATPRWRNPSFYDGPMIPFDNHHDMEAKVLMNGFSMPAGQSAVDDLNQAINHVFMHPNVGPFVATRLIRHFVTSNPSPQYITRITQVFNDNGNGNRGDLAAVIKAILLDPEAASVMPNGGHLREPVLFEIALLRALGATVDPGNPLYSRARDMGQSLFSPPSVFNYYSPLYRIPGTPQYGPEFQIHSFSNAMNRANFVDRVVRNNLGTGASIDLTALESLADNPAQLVSQVAEMLLHETLSAAELQSIETAISVSSTPSTRVRNAVYLVATSSRYQVQH